MTARCLLTFLLLTTFSSHAYAGPTPRSGAGSNNPKGAKAGALPTDTTAATTAAGDTASAPHQLLAPVCRDLFRRVP
jgi:hypothetical protein